MYEDNNNNQHSEVTESTGLEGTTDLEIDQTYDSNTSNDIVHFIVQQQHQMSQIVLGEILSVTKAIMVDKNYNRAVIAQTTRD
ncbi:hypothetical protein PAXRUDRAFT_151279 [Paxillus rubicundulus Ve08.2h10]|uniref:Uncharacterized protein n=1 Tax=Paxillus rubicundulus Ve08.2h10 TaxID=930991 RepID=A0A0D0DRZ7_9AGAM|nr:hypothetical protein PAXRUDRAFT_151279 [Paxillus rubicundulus Ve08.2h10]